MEGIDKNYSYKCSPEVLARMKSWIPTDRLLDLWDAVLDAALVTHQRECKTAFSSCVKEIIGFVDDYSKAKVSNKLAVNHITNLAIGVLRLALLLRGDNKTINKYHFDKQFMNNRIGLNREQHWYLKPTETPDS